MRRSWIQCGVMTRQSCSMVCLKNGGRTSGRIFTVRQVGRAAFPCKTARVFHRKLLGLRFNRRFCSILQLADEVALLHACGGERWGDVTSVWRTKVAPEGCILLHKPSGQYFLNFGTSPLVTATCSGRWKLFRVVHVAARSIHCGP